MRNCNYNCIKLRKRKKLIKRGETFDFRPGFRSNAVKCLGIYITDASEFSVIHAAYAFDMAAAHIADTDYSEFYFFHNYRPLLFNSFAV